MMMDGRTRDRADDADDRDIGGLRAEPGESAVTRAFGLIAELASGELDIGQIADCLGLSERSAFRYIDRINRASSARSIIVRRGRRYSLARSPQLADLVGGSFDEGAVAAIASTPLGGLVKRKGVLPSRVVERVRPLVDLSRGEREDPVLAELFAAMLRGGYLSFTYASGGGPKEHLCVPVRLYLDPVQVYLAAWDEERGHLICLASSKISGIKAVPGKRMDEAAFRRLGDWCRSAWGKMIRHDQRKISLAVFEAAPSVAPYFLRHPLRADQSTEELEGGALRVSVKIHNPLEFARWALRFGDSLIVTGDEEVLAEMRSFLARMSARYGASSGTEARP